MDHAYVRCVGCGGVRVEDRTATLPYSRRQLPCPDCGGRTWEIHDRDPDEPPGR